MVEPTPGQADKRDRPTDPPSPSEGVSRRAAEVVKIRALISPLPASFRGSEAYLFTAGVNIVVFFLLFQPWVVAIGRTGKITANAFGRLYVSSGLTNLWSASPPPPANINGTWAVLASVAIAINVFAVVINLQARSDVLSRVAMGSAVAPAFFVVGALVQMNTKLSAIKRMVGYGNPRDVGNQIGMVIRWASGNGSYPVPGLRQVQYSSASLTTTAWLEGALAVLSALVVLAEWARQRPAAGHRQRRLRVKFSQPPSGSDRTE
ncbi:hypothetical protein AB0C34_01695 [Nocardia sp. NPDC049220]|uniref:hypothetical protein n=1 Tax=Nocardia sp. NPDC049220 TaxID=3155273 RepID=UPI0033F70238